MNSRELPRSIRWFSDQASALAFEQTIVSGLQDARAVQEVANLDGWCNVCRRESAFIVSTGATFAGRPNLREGMLCPECKLTARQRSMIAALRATIEGKQTAKGAMLERLSRLYRRTKIEFPRVDGSEFLAEGYRSGSYHAWISPSRRWLPRIVRHESILSLSYESASLDFIAHTDVLEHVSDTGAALRECHRVLKPGGFMVFTVPFSTNKVDSKLRGYLSSSGVLVELLPGEYHGDGLQSEGIYTFHNFGWSFFDELIGTFGRSEIGFLYEPRKGLLYADSVESDWNMAPIVFRAQKG